MHVLILIFIHWLLKQVTNFYETIFQGYKKIVLFRSENCDFMHQNLSANRSGTMFDLCEAAAAAHFLSNNFSTVQALSLFSITPEQIRQERIAFRITPIVD